MTDTKIVTDERNFRPLDLADFIGQEKLKPVLRTMLDAAQARRSALEHLVFYGPPGLGKTTLAGIVANTLGGRFIETSGPAMTKPGDLAKVVSLIQKGDVLFVDEIHGLNRPVQDMLLKVMEDFVLTIPLDGKDESRALTLPVPRFTLIGATTDYGLISGPMRDRFGHGFYLEPYSADELSQVALRAFDKLGLLVDEESVEGIARRSRGTPRVALNLVRRVADLATVTETEFVSTEMVDDMMAQLGLDEAGLTDIDRRYLATLVNVYRGGPAGPKAIATSAGIDLATLENVVEPALQLLGFVARTPRGRRITRAGYAHIAPYIVSPPVINWRKVESSDSAPGDALRD